MVQENWFMNKMKSVINKYYPHYPKEGLEKIYYGLDGLYRTVPKLIIILLLGIALGSVRETLMLILFFNILRHVAFGVHASSSYICFIVSSIIFIGISLIAPLIVINKISRLLIGGICLIIFALYAPADTKKRPLLNAKKRTSLKAISVLIGIIYILMSLLIKNNLVVNTLIFALIIESILILPITYMFFKQTYKNYNNY